MFLHGGHFYFCVAQVPARVFALFGIIFPRQRQKDFIKKLIKSCVVERKSVAEVFGCLGKDMAVDRPDDRLKIQKIMYLLQEYGVDLGYAYNWYVNGPYCKAVNDDANGHEFEPGPSALSPDAKIKIQKFRQAFKDDLDDPKWLEVAASLVYLWNKKYDCHPLSEIVSDLIDDMSFGLRRFHPCLVIAAVADLQKNQFFRNGARVVMN